MHEEFGVPKTRDERIDHLVHLYVDGAYTRRQLIRRLARFTGGAAAATTLLASRGLAQSGAPCPDNVRVPEDAEDIQCYNVQYPGKAGILYGLLTQPNPLVKALPAILVIHENRGLTDHIRDVTRRVARAGFIGLGIDLLSRQGGSHNFANDTLRGQAYGRTVTAERLEDMLSSIDYLKSEGFVLPDRIGAVGFCAGGGNVFLLALNSPDLAAGVPYYGTPPNPLPSVADMKAALLCIFSETDRNQNARIPELVSALVAQRKTFGLHLYPGSGHGFHNDTGSVYNAEAACDAWAKTMSFFHKQLDKPDPA